MYNKSIGEGFIGFFNRFEKKDKQNIRNIVDYTQSIEQLPFYVEFRQTSKGYLQIEFYDNNLDFGQFYDITKLIVDRQPLNIKGRQVYNCAVSWYRRDACIMFNEKLTEVLVEIVLKLFQSDPNYCYNVMKNLLNKQRVERYLEI